MFALGISVLLMIKICNGVPVITDIDGGGTNRLDNHDGFIKESGHQRIIEPKQPGLENMFIPQSQRMGAYGDSSIMGWNNGMGNAAFGRGWDSSYRDGNRYHGNYDDDWTTLRIWRWLRGDGWRRRKRWERDEWENQEQEDLRNGMMRGRMDLFADPLAQFQQTGFNSDRSLSNMLIQQFSGVSMPMGRVL